MKTLDDLRQELQVKANYMRTSLKNDKFAKGIEYAIDKMLEWQQTATPTKVYIVKQPDQYWTTPHATLDDAKAEIMYLEGKDYRNNAWGIYEYDFSQTTRGKEVGAMVCVEGKYKYLVGKELEEYGRK